MNEQEMTDDEKQREEIHEAWKNVDWGPIIAAIARENEHPTYSKCITLHIGEPVETTPEQAAALKKSMDDFNRRHEEDVRWRAEHPIFRRPQ